MRPGLCALTAVLAVALLLSGCETLEWWLSAENRAMVPYQVRGRAVSGVLAVILIPFVLYAIYKGYYNDRTGRWGGGR